MNPKQEQTIERFANRLPDSLTDHWNEIVTIINEIGEDKYISEIELENMRLEIKTKRLEEGVRGFLILKEWVKEGKITTRRGFNGFCDVFIGKCQGSN